MTATATGAAADNRKTATCDVCPRHCRLAEGATGFCHARACRDGRVVAANYGRLTSIALDPIEKKPIARWKPGSTVVSVGSYGCNLRCPFCQNWQISQAGEADVPWREVTPSELVKLAVGERKRERARGREMAGIAYTYNEPLVGWEYVRDCGRLAHEAGLANVLVSNGCAGPRVIDALAPLVDAANIDLKSFSPAFYDACGGFTGTLDAVRHTIETLAATPTCHLEVTTLVVPGMNDSATQVRELARWLRSVDPGIVLHVTRFFPRWHLTDRDATPREVVYRLADVAREELPCVLTGNC
jgi:pyruvate formate lyase activating enzyme